MKTIPAMISIDEALRTVLEVAQRLPPVIVSLHDALGKVLAEDIRAPDPLPPYPASVKVISTSKTYDLTLLVIAFSVIDNCIFKDHHYLSHVIFTFSFFWEIAKR